MKIEQAKNQYSRFNGLPFRKHQREAIEAIYNTTKPVMIVKAPTGCHTWGQKILMYDGGLKQVQNIKLHDKLMGPDGCPRKVINLIRGSGQMCRIKPVKGNPFIVNLDHILTLKRSNDGTKQAGKLIDISVREYLGKSNTFKHTHKLVRTGVDFETNNNLTIDPYMLGVLLGDGMLTHQVGVSNCDHEVIDSVYEYAKNLGLKIRRAEDSYYFYGKYIRDEHGKLVKNSNCLMKELREIGLYGTKSDTKFIPHEYLTSSRESRLELLAGLIDTDGYLSNGTYDYITKSKNLCDDILFLCRSLGFAAYATKCNKSCQNNFTGEYYRICISGKLNYIPCKVKRRRAHARRQIKDHLVTGFSVEPLNLDNYYGFTLTGDGRYLLDDFTITHNSGKSLMGMALGELYPKFAYLCSSKSLQDQLSREFSGEVQILKGRSNYPCSWSTGLNAAQCINSQNTPCPEQSKCAYKLQKRKVDQSRRQILNYPYVLSEFNYVHSMNSGEPYPIMIADEADVLENLLTGFISLSISSHNISKYGLDAPPFKTFSQTNANAWIDWSLGLNRKLRAKLDYVMDQVANCSGMQPYEQIELQKEQKEIEGLLIKLNIFSRNVDKTWIANMYDRYSEFKPLWLKEDLARQFYWRHARKHVLMSATWPSKEIISRSLGIPLGDIDMIEVPSIFPVGANPVNLCNIGDMSYKTINQALPRIISAITRILSHHANHKGVIHTGNYKVAEAIMSTRNSRLITHNSFNKQEQIERFMSSTKPLVFVSPSSTRGMDLPDDLCRFTITAKAPFQSLTDRYISGRMHSKPIGQQWYISSCAQEIEQGVGRGMRSQSDWCENYILDIAACRMITSNPQLFGQYFLDSRQLCKIASLAA